MADDATTLAASARVRDLVGSHELRRLMARRDGPGLRFAAGHLGLLGLTGTALALAPAGAAFWLAMFVHGIVIVHLFAPFHEACHATAFRTRALDGATAWITGLLILLPPLNFRHEHADHHTYTQSLRRDPQMIPIGESFWGYLWYATSIPYLVNAASVLLRHPLGRFNATERAYIPEAERAAVQREAAIFWLVYGAAAAASALAGSWALLTYWLIPRLVAEPVMRLIRMAEHVGCARTEDMLENTRTILTSAPARWLAWNMALHTAHHAVPQLPFHALPALNRILEPHIRHATPGYVATVAGHLAKTWRAAS